MTVTTIAPGPGDTGCPWGWLDGGRWGSDKPVSWQECGPLESEAMVMGVLNEAFDVLVLKFGVQKRIYCNVSTSHRQCCLTGGGCSSLVSCPAPLLCQPHSQQSCRQAGLAGGEGAFLGFPLPGLEQPHL